MMGLNHEDELQILFTVGSFSHKSTNACGNNALLTRDAQSVIKPRKTDWANQKMTKVIPSLRLKTASPTACLQNRYQGIGLSIKWQFGMLTQFWGARAPATCLPANQLTSDACNSGSPRPQPRKGEGGRRPARLRLARCAKPCFLVSYLQ